MCEWDDFCYFWVAIMSEALLKFLLKRIYGLKEDVGWRIPRWLFKAWPSLMCKWGDVCYFWIFILSEAFHQFSAQEYIWFGRWWCLRNPRWLFSAWQSLMCQWGDISYFWVSILPETFNLISNQENIWFGRRWFLFVCFCCLTSQVNSYGHCGTVSSPNHTFFLGRLEQAVNQ